MELLLYETIGDNAWSLAADCRWIALNAAFVVLLLVFLLALLIDAPSTKSTRMYSRHNLKSSALTTLFHGLDVSVQERALDVGHFNTLNEIEKMAKDQAVILQQTPYGMKLSYTKKLGYPWTLVAIL